MSLLNPGSSDSNTGESVMGWITPAPLDVEPAKNSFYNYNNQ